MSDDYARHTLTAERRRVRQSLQVLQRQFYETHGPDGNDKDQATYRSKLASLDRAIALLGKTD